MTAPTSYREFIESKRQLAGRSGFEPIWMPVFLKDFQTLLVDWAVRKGRAAIFASCGLGKTPMQLVWAENVVRKTGRPVLVVTPLSVGPQTVREGEKFGIECHRSADGRFPSGARIVVTNYERLHHFSPADFSGAVADESSGIKHFDARRTAVIIEFFRTLPYRLLCTATAAPNDYIELGTSAEALGEMGYQDILGRFFKQQTSKDHLGWGRTKYYLRPHAARDFWRWVCSWARAVRYPSDLGCDDTEFILPPLVTVEHIIRARTKRSGMLFDMPAVTLEEQREERRRTLPERCEKVAELVDEQAAHSIAWCHLNDEGDMLERIIPGSAQVSGKDSDDEKERKIEWFLYGDGDLPGRKRVLVSKPEILGFGLNFQHCSHETFFPSHCYDEMTEVLTKRGWMTFGEVSTEDEVATVHQESLAFEWQNPTEVIWGPYEGPMVRFGSGGSYSRSFDLLVTPNHRMFVKRCPVRHPSSAGNWEIKTAADLATRFRRLEYKMLSAPRSFRGESIEAVEIPLFVPESRQSVGAINRRGDGRGMSPSSRTGLDRRRSVHIPTIPARQFMQLAGWYLTEGHCGRRGTRLDGQIRITQTDKNPEHRIEIIEMFRSIPGLNVYRETKDIRVCSRQLAIYLVDQFGAGSYGKKIPTWVKELTPELLTILRDTMLKGDGCSQRRGEIKRSYRSVSKRLADDFAEICLKTGIRGSVQYREQSSGKYTGYGCWEVNIARENLEPSIHVQPEMVPYAGMIGCVSVPNGTVIVRRKGIPVVSGNSFESYFQAVRRCWRYGQVHPVRVDMVASEGERGVLENLNRKAKAADAMFANLVELMDDHLGIRRDNPFTSRAEAPPWLSPDGTSSADAARNGSTTAPPAPAPGAGIP